MRWIVSLIGLFGGILQAADPVTQPSAEAIEFFEKKVRPVLAENCYSCHGEKKQSAGLRLDNAIGLKQGADNGLVVVPGDPGKSRLITSVKREGEYAMPPKGSLSPEAVSALVEWVKMGSPYPAAIAKSGGVDPKKHWAFQPLKTPKVPLDKTAAGSEIDAFVRVKLSEAKLTSAPNADRRTLIRRAYYDLIGLPPTAAEVEAFEKDSSPKAFEKVIDHLLATPQYGERWGRYWLDVARYADTKGYVFQEERNFPYAYTYRDYVVRSFNEDKPFNQFIIEQIAADKLPLGEDKRTLAAMGYLTLGRRFLNSTPDIVDDRIDVVTRGFMGLTVQCARCHDHKFDPIPAKDYYSLYGVFASSVEPKELPLLGQTRTPAFEAFEKELAKREAAFETEAIKRHDSTLARLRKPDVVAEYLRTYFDTRNKTGEQVNNLIRERDLSNFAFNKWKNYLNDSLKKQSPIFSPLADLYAIPEGEFKSKTTVVISNLEKDAEKRTNPMVLKALQESRLETFAVACRAVAKVLTDATKEQPELSAVLGPKGPLDIARSDSDKIMNRADKDALIALRKKIDSFKATSPDAPPRAQALTDGTIVDPVVFLRGNPGNRGPAVPRQMLEVVAGSTRKPFTGGSGRLDLARAIASPENPLTARVFVNRVWLGHFGAGLVRTPSDFGLRSDPPTHPELLDWLATRFIADGWSVKKLHKRIMLSETYQQSSNATVAPGGVDVKATDPDNRLLSHQNRRRLDFESLRDSLLFAANHLDTTVGGRPVDLFKAPFTTRRTIYGSIDRSNLPGTFRVFDLASPDQHSPQRFQTTVPQQALFMLNSPFVAEQAKSLATRPELAKAKTLEDKLTILFRVGLARKPTSEELALAIGFVDPAGNGKEDPAKWLQFAQVLLMNNEFVFVD